MARRKKPARGGSRDSARGGASERPRRGAPKPAARDRQPSELRIIGGDLRGSRLAYSGRFDTRPMKDRVREAIFNLVGPAVKGMHAVDLFAGTGALGLEALSRGAATATMIERHVPTSKGIRQNLERLDLTGRAEVLAADAFFWGRQAARGDDVRPDGARWLVFCSPPYDFYLSRSEAMLELIGQMVDTAPPDSRIVVEADARFDFGVLPRAEAWDVRRYPPAVVGLLKV